MAHAAPAAPHPGVLVKTITLKPRKLAESLVAYGRVKPDPAAVKRISVAHGGRVVALSVGAGQAVRAGQALLKLAASPQVRLAYAQSQAQLQYAQQNLVHVKALYERRLATNDQLAAAKKQLSTARAALTAARAQGGNKAVVVIRAPHRSVVSAIKVMPGDRVAPNAVLMTLLNPDRLWVRLGVPPNDLARLKPGLPAALTPVFDNAPTVHAQLTRLQAVVNPTTNLMDALVALKGKQTDGLKPGMWIKGLITVRQVTELAVPRQAVLRDTRGSYVFVVRQNKARRVNVTVDFATRVHGGWIGIRAGAVEAGDKVAVRGNYELHDGMAVREKTAQ